MTALVELAAAVAALVWPVVVVALVLRAERRILAHFLDLARNQRSILTRIRRIELRLELEHRLAAAEHGIEPGHGGLGASSTGPGAGSNLKTETADGSNQGMDGLGGRELDGPTPPPRTGTRGRTRPGRGGR